MGLKRPAKGRILYDGVSYWQAEAEAQERLKRRFGVLFQSGALLGWLSVFDNVALPLREKTRMTEDEIAERVNTVLGLVELGEDGDKFPDEISGGMQKRAGLARAIIRSPEIVLYDEPTSGLDPMTARTIDKLIRKLSDQLGITSVVVSHDLQGSLLIGDRIAMLKNGRFLEVSPPKVFVASDQPDVRGFLDAQFIPKTGVVGM